MDKNLIELLAAYRIARAIPEDRVLDKDDIAQFLKVIEVMVKRIEGIWPN